jgi:hypothetical protein
MIKNVISFIHLFIILIKNMDFRVLSLGALDGTVWFSMLS